MPSPGRPAVPARTGWRKRSQSRTSRPRLRIVALLSVLGAFGALGSVLIGGAVAKPGCASSQTTSRDGTVVHGSACADEIVVTSPLVRKVYGGDGDDVIYANDDVEEIYGGAGNDVIYGDHSEAEGGPGANGEPGEGISYEPAPYSRTERRARLRRGPHATASNKVDCSESPCYGGDGSQEMFGGPGADTIFGERGNDTIYGDSGRDALFGGIGDDTIHGNDGPDLLAGGLGTDTLNGDDGSDLVRGDGTIDVLRDTGAAGDTDTLSFATAVAPGFRGFVSTPGFPADNGGEERGVEVRLDGARAGCGVQSCNNDARYGGGGDEISVAGFENVIGSPFADRIVGSAGPNRIDGGGGADVLEGGGGDDRLYGGADGDYMVGGPGTDRTFFAEEGANNCAPDVEYRYGCTSAAAEVHQRDRSRIEVGYLNAPIGGLDWNQIYMVGSQGADIVDVKTSYASLYGWVAFTAGPGSATFDTSVSASSPNCNYKPTEVKCTLLQHMDAITIAGMAGDDRLSIAGNETQWDNTTTPTILGGRGNDVLIGSGQTEDVLVDGDGPGNDTLHGFGFDDALLNNEGTDDLQAGAGSDLLLSATICDGDTLQGAESKKGDAEDDNNASWSQLPWGAVVADLQRGTAGGEYVEFFPTIATASTASASAKPNENGNNNGGYSGPGCTSGSLDRLQNIDDLEGSAQSDALYGNAKSNNLLGRNGEDFLFGRGGDDRIAAKDGQHDEVGGGGGKDICVYDEGLDTVKLCNP